MIPIEKCPFKGRTYFFDLRFYRNQEELSKNIRKLGGKIETFLCEEVTHVITDKPNFKSKVEPWTPATPRSYLSVPSPMTDNVNYDSSIYLSPTNENRQHVLSRGQALVQKAKLKSQGSTDIYGLCDQLKIKVLPLQRVLIYIEHYKEYLKKQNREKKEKKAKPFFEVLSPPFIKIEDNSRCFKPVYKAFTSWKSYFYPSFLRVATKIQEQFSKDTSSVFKPIENLQPSSMNNQKLKNTYNLQFINPNVKPIQEQLKKKNESKNHAKDKQKKDTKHKKNMVKKLYCEICSSYFRDLEEHLLTRKHKEFLSKVENFRSIHEISNSLPTLDEFLKKNQTISIDAAQVLECGNQDKMLGKGASNSDSGSETFVEASCVTSEFSEPFPCLDNFKGNSSSSSGVNVTDYQQILDVYAKCSHKLAENELQVVSNSQNLLSKTAPSATVTTENSKGSILCYETLTPGTPDKIVSLGDSEIAKVSTSVNFTQISTTTTSSQIVEKDRIKHSNVHVSVADFSQFVETSLCDDSVNIMLNINGCPIPKYPFRNFGFGCANTGLGTKSSLNHEQTDIFPQSSKNDVTVDKESIEKYPSYSYQHIEEFENFSENKLFNNTYDDSNAASVAKNLMFSSVAIDEDDNGSMIDFHIDNDGSDRDDLKTIHENIDDLYQSLCLCEEQPIDLSLNHNIEVEMQT